MFGRRPLESDEYKRLALRMTDVEQRAQKVEHQLTLYDERFRSFAGRFHRHLKDGEEDEEPTAPKALSKPFSPFGV